MNELINNLRLQIAQFNNFIIENYLASVKNKTNNNEPQRYLFDSFFRLSESLSALGSAFGNIDDVQIEDIISLKEAIVEATSSIYLIEKSADLSELTLSVKGIITGGFNNSIQNITAYGKQFNKDQNSIDTEIQELQQDNTEYFNNNGSFKFSIYQIHLEEAIIYLSSNAAVVQVKSAFKKVNDTYQYFSSIILSADNTGKNYCLDQTFLSNLLNTLSVLLIALGYSEPFFEKRDDVIRLFEQHIRDIVATQTVIFDSL